MAKKKVAIIDDSELALEATSLDLEDAGFAVVKIASPIGSSITLSFEKPDLVLVDLNMTSVRGDELIKKMLTNRHLANCKFVLFSDAGVDEISRRATECGAHGFVSKSSGKKALVAAIAGLIGTK